MTYLCKWWIEFALIIAATTGFAHADVVVPENYAASTVAVGLTDGRDIIATPDGRIFIALGGGDIRVVENDTLLPTAMISIPVSNRAEEGLQNLALDQDFEQNGFIYVVFTPAGGGGNRVSRFTVVGNVADPATERVVFELPPLLGATNHYGAAVVDNADGTLLITVGDHNISSNGQNTSTRTGSVLRIAKDGSIPGDNPFVGTPGVDDATFAFGVRNPWKIAKSTGGAIAVSDVGASSWEELNMITPGGNFGWNEAEGPGGLGEQPLFAYPHFGQVQGAQFEGCAIAGSTFYEPDQVQFPNRFVGHLFSGDFCAGWIAAIDPATGSVEPFATGFNAIADVTTNPANGALYVLDRNLVNGRPGISKIEFVGPDATLRITSHPTSQQLAIGQRASFFVAAIGQGNLEYQWQRDTVDIPGANSPLLEIPSVSSTDNNAQFRAIVTDDVDTVTSSVAEIIVTTNNPPEPIIAVPAPQSTYGGGQTIVIRGDATDIEDGSVPVSSFQWDVRFNHDEHDHGFTGEVTGTDELIITIPDTGETSPNVWYTVYLRVTDSDGASTTVTRRIDPRVVNFSLETLPAGGVLNLDGPPVTTHFSAMAVEGLKRTVRAPVLQDIDGETQAFVAWSDGGEIEHTFDMPSSDLSLTATYAPLPFGNSGTPECTVVRIADSAVISFSSTSGSLNLRRNGAWIQTVTGFDSYVDADNPSLSATYVMRIRAGNSVIDYPCSTEQWPPGPTPEPTPEMSCSVSVHANDVLMVSYSGFTDVSSVQIRRNGGWIASGDLGEGNFDPGVGAFDDTSALPGVAYSYVIRSRPGGVVTDFACSPATITIGDAAADAETAAEAAEAAEAAAAEAALGEFVPDPNKVYHIDNPAHGLRLAARSGSQVLESASLNSTGDDTRWRFVQSPTDGLWHIRRAAGGPTPGIRTVLTTTPDMQAASSSGVWTRFSIEANADIPGTYLLTVPLANTVNQRLRLLGNGTTDFATCLLYTSPSPRDRG